MANLEKIKQLLEIHIVSPTSLRWVVDRTSKTKAGDIAGCLCENGYYSVGINRRLYLNHRIVYALYHNVELDQLPKYIDHIDRNRTNNNPLNLRPATRSQNQANAGLRKNNTSGMKGVYWHPGTKKWRARIMYLKKHLHLGLFEDIEDAKRAYQEASLKYFGEFASLV